jgi:hypothetical protein
MNTQEARKIAGFVSVNETSPRTYKCNVPGHDGKRYFVIIRTNGVAEAECWDVTDRAAGEIPCPACAGRNICYHILAAMIAIGNSKGWKLSLLSDPANADRLSRMGGRTFRIVRKNGATAEAFAVAQEQTKRTSPVRKRFSNKSHDHDKAF